jgi:hypothetical protein
LGLKVRHDKDRPTNPDEPHDPDIPWVPVDPDIPWVPELDWEYPYYMDLYYTSETTPYLLCQELRKTWADWIDFYATDYGMDRKICEPLDWIVTETNQVALREQLGLDTRLSFEWISGQEQTTLETGLRMWMVDEVLWERPKIDITWDRSQSLALHADFITQADNQHLGYTGVEYYPLKQYEIKRNTPYFTISLFEEVTLRPIELPEDGKDYVVIEAVISRKYEV